jgi:hypothetical protein
MFELALTAQVLFWLIVLGVFLASNQASIYHPLTVYLFFHGLVFVLRPLLVHYLGFDTIWRYMWLEPSELVQMKALAVTSLALTVFATTCMLSGRCYLAFPKSAPAPFSQVQRRALIVATVILLPAILYSVRAISRGGLQGENRGGTFILTGATGYALEAQFMAGPLICAWMVVTRFRWPTVLIFLLYAGYRSYQGLDRWSVVLLFLAISLVYAWHRRLRWIAAWSLVLVIPVYMLFHTLGKNRAYFKMLGDGEPALQEAVDTSLPRQERLKLDYDNQEFANFDYLCFILEAVPARTGTFTYFSQYLQLFTEPIPRKLWPGKPVGAPVGFFNLNSYGNFIGLTYSLPGDGWMSGGWVGLIVTMGVVGTFLGFAHKWFWRNFQNNMFALSYLVFLAMIPQWYRDGSISIFKFAFWNLSPLLCWLGLSWVLGDRRLPTASILIPPGARIRLVGQQQMPIARQ